MKKHLSLALRLLVAIAGLAYIAYMIDWTDRVELDPKLSQVQQLTWQDGSRLQLSKKTLFNVVSGDFDPRNLTTPITIADRSDSPTPGRQLTVSPAQLADANSGMILRPGLLTTLRHANYKLLLLGLLIIAPIYPITAMRWWWLLKVRGLHVPPWKAFRLCMVGCFFNYCMPGSTGGDVIKAYYTAKGTDRRADAVMTVIIDRIVGLLGLFVLAGIAGAFIQQDSRVHKVTLFVWCVAAAVVIVSALYFSRRLRKASGLDWLLSKLLKKDSLLFKVDQAAAAYSEHKMVVLGSILASLPVHLLLAVSTSLAGWALGMQTPLTTLLAVVPMIFLVMAIPISPQGVGTTELIALALLNHPPIAMANQIVVMLVVARLYQLTYSLTGSIFLLQGDIQLHPPASDADGNH